MIDKFIKFTSWSFFEIFFYLGWHSILWTIIKWYNIVKSVLSGHSKEHQRLFFNTDNRLMQVKNIAEYSEGSILQYFRPPVTYYFH